jgi:CrcB protein
MGFAIPIWENRLTLSALMTPASGHRLYFVIMAYLWVALGGALGSVARYGINGLVSAAFGQTFPWGTLIVNVTGSFIIGFLGAITESETAGPYRVTIIQFFIVGICGGYTTFSSFSLQTLNLVREREWLYAAGNVLLSVVLCMIAVWLGWMLGTLVHSTKGH